MSSFDMNQEQYVILTYFYGIVALAYMLLLEKICKDFCGKHCVADIEFMKISSG